MKSLIVYSSKTGNTKKLAEAIQAFLPGESISKSVDEKPDSNGFDLICLGFWFQAGRADSKATEFLQSLDCQSPLFLYATHGAAADSDHAGHGMKLAAELVSSNTVIGSFSCQGEVNSELLAKAQKMNPPPPWIDDAPQAAGHPDDIDISRLEKTLHEALSRIEG